MHKTTQTMCMFPEKLPLQINAPTDREIIGGTIINVTYEGSRISNTLKGAFEYACRLMEERMPTIYPLNIKVQIANFRDNQCLAMVEPIPMQNQWYDDRAYYKRSSHFDPGYTGEYFEPTLDFFKGTDAVINFLQLSHLTIISILKTYSQTNMIL